MANVFDFGFTLVDEDELDVSVQKEVAVESAHSLQDKIDELYNAITPLLNNLKSNPEKEYIKWPDRVIKVEQFETYLQEIYRK
jgi:hypothetical protein